MSNFQRLVHPILLSHIHLKDKKKEIDSIQITLKPPYKLQPGQIQLKLTANSLDAKKYNLHFLSKFSKLRNARWCGDKNKGIRLKTTGYAGDKGSKAF